MKARFTAYVTLTALAAVLAPLAQASIYGVAAARWSILAGGAR